MQGYQTVWQSQNRIVRCRSQSQGRGQLAGHQRQGGGQLGGRVRGMEVRGQLARLHHTVRGQLGRPEGPLRR